MIFCCCKAYALIDTNIKCDGWIIGKYFIKPKDANNFRTLLDHYTLDPLKVKLDFMKYGIEFVKFFGELLLEFNQSVDTIWRK